MSKPRDSQREAVYTWERAVVKAARAAGAEFPELTLDACRDLIARVWSEYCPNHRPPVVCDGRGRRRASGCWREIHLPRWARTAPMVLHELAHAILDLLDCPEAWHGKRFARFLVQLWDRHADFGGMTVGQMVTLGVHQKPRRVRFASPKDTPARLTRPARGAMTELHRLSARRKRLDERIAKATEQLRAERDQITDQIKALRLRIREEQSKQAAARPE